MLQSVHRWLLLRKGQRRKMGLDSSCLNLASEQTWASQPACRANWITLTPPSSPPPLSLSWSHISPPRPAHLHSHWCQISPILPRSHLVRPASCSLPALLTLHCSAPPLPTDCSGCSAARSAGRLLLWFLKSLVIARILRQPPAAGRIKPRRAHTQTGRPPNQSQAPADRLQSKVSFEKKTQPAKCCPDGSCTASCSGRPAFEKSVRV